MGLRVFFKNCFVLTFLSVHCFGALTFEEAYQHLIENACEIKAARSAVGAAQGNRLQVGLRVNPQFNFEWNSIGNGTAEDAANELFVGATHWIEFGGKRQARVHAADAVTTAVSWDLEILKTQLFGQLLHAFIKTASAEKRTHLAKEQQGVLEETLECLRSKKNEGKTSLIECKRAELNLRTGKLKLAQSEKELRQAHAELRGLWDGHPPAYDAIQFDMQQIVPPPSYKALVENLTKTAEVQRANAEICKAFQAVQLEKTGRYPDAAFQMGVSTYRFTHDPSLSISLDVLIPIFDRNQGNICRARYEHSEAVFNRAALFYHLQTSLALMREGWQTAFEQAAEIRDALLPLAYESYQLAKEGREAGKFEWLELLDARTALFSMQEMYLDALEEYQHKRADLLTATAVRCLPSEL